MSTTPSADARFRGIFDVHHRELHAYFLRRLPVGEANEAVADLFLAAWRRMDRVPLDEARPWLYAVGRDVLVAWRQRRTQVRLVARDGVTVPVVAGARDVQIVRHPHDEAVHRGLGTLTEIDREIVQLMCWEGLPIDEIAKILALSERSVIRRYRRALVRLVDGVGVDSVGMAQRIESADAVGSSGEFPTGAVTSGALLALIDERHNLASGESPVVMDDPAGSGRRLALTLLAGGLASALVVLLAVMFTGVLYEAAPSTSPQTTIPPTTAVVPTTEALSPASPVEVPSDAEALAVVEAMYERWSAGDIDGYRAFIDESAAAYSLGSLDHSAWYQVVTGATAIRSCEALGDGVVHCTTDYYSGLEPGPAIMREEIDVTVNGGKIVLAQADPGVGPFSFGFDRVALANYRDWVLANEPDRVDELFVFSYGILLHTPELRATHRTLVDRHRTETFPAAVDRDADPIKVIDTYYGLRRDADIDGYQQLTAALSPEPRTLVPSDEEVRYLDVTGMAIGRICDNASPIQVRCDLTYYSGLAPGVELTGRILLYTVIDGLIVDIEALSPIENYITADESALAQYRTWLSADDPEAAADLFTDGGEMILETEAARSAHVAHISRFWSR